MIARITRGGEIARKGGGDDDGGFQLWIMHC